MILGVIPGALVAALRHHHNSVLYAVIDVYSSYWFLLAAFTIAYRLSPYHPLSSFPGPFLCKISKIRMAYISGIRGTTHLYVQKLHQRYGDVVRIGESYVRLELQIYRNNIQHHKGPNELSIIHKDITNSVLGPKGLPRGPCEYDCLLKRTTN